MDAEDPRRYWYSSSYASTYASTYASSSASSPPPASTTSAGSLNHFGVELWVVVIIYLAILVGILVFVALKDHDPVFTSRHFLASRNMGTVVLGFSLCASMFSGYTVVGIPAEAWSDGFSAWRWVGSCTFISLVYLAYAPRLCYLSHKFGYDSLLAFIKQRYALGPCGHTCCHTLLFWLIVAVILIPSFIYLCAQFIAVSNTVNSLSDNAVSKTAVAVIFGAVLTVYEIFGGLTAVSVTDVMQGGFLMFGTISILGFLDAKYGGLDSVTERLPTKSVIGALEDTDNFALSWAEFWVGVGLQRALFPDYLQRSYAAKKQSVLQKGNIILLLAPFIVQVPLIFYGLIGKAVFPDLREEDKNMIFTEVVKDISGDGPGSAVLAAIMMAASMAAIMSTADSVLISVSHIFSIDLLKPCLGKPPLSPEEEQAEAEAHHYGVGRAFKSELAHQPGAKTDEDEEEAEPKRMEHDPRLVYLSGGITCFLCLLCIPFAHYEVNQMHMTKPNPDLKPNP